MRTIILAGVVCLQIAVLAFMAGSREWIVRTGRTVFLRTAPVDPRDPMRGDYVVLDYDASRVPLSLWSPSLANALTGSPARTNYRYRKSVPVCAALRMSDDSLAEVASLADMPPADGPFLIGRIEQNYYSGWHHGAQVKYGIEAWFVEQGTGTNLDRRRMQEGIQLPLEMEVALSSRGKAVLKGYRWASMGIGLDLVMQDRPRTNTWVPERPAGATLRLLNAGTDDVAIVNVPGSTWRLLPEDRSGWDGSAIVWAGESLANKACSADDVVLLAPGQVLTNTFSFDNPLWFVLNTGRVARIKTPVPISHESNTWSNFRFEYRAPDRETCAGLPNADKIWHGHLLSRSFSSGGTVD